MSEKKYDLLCIGATILDCIVKGFNPEPVSKMGYRAGSTGLAPGGEALNQAVIASRLGLKVAICSAIGKDEAGKVLQTTLEENDVSCEHLLPRKGNTPITIMFVDETGNRKSITNQAHYEAFGPEEHLEMLKEARAVSLGSLFRAPFLDPDKVELLLKEAKALQLPVYVDTKLPNCKELSLEDYKNCFPYIDYLTPNEDEARCFSGKEDPDEMADVFLDYGIPNIIIKLGARGCLFKNKTERYLLPAFPVSAIDATGAGDNFLAGFITAKSRGASHYDALRYASACAAISVTSIGAISGLQNEEQIKELIQ